MLRQPPGRRNTEEMLRLLPLFRECEFFKKSAMDDRLLLEVISTSRHEFAEKGKIIFRYGDKGDKFYLILHGSVSASHTN